MHRETTGTIKVGKTKKKYGESLVALIMTFPSSFMATSCVDGVHERMVAQR